MTLKGSTSSHALSTLAPCAGLAPAPQERSASSPASQPSGNAQPASTSGAASSENTSTSTRPVRRSLRLANLKRKATTSVHASVVTANMVLPHLIDLPHARFQKQTHRKRHVQTSTVHAWWHWACFSRAQGSTQSLLPMVKTWTGQTQHFLMHERASCTLCIPVHLGSGQLNASKVLHLHQTAGSLVS